MAGEGIPVEVACRVLDVSVSGYYDWRSRPPSERAIRHAWLTDLIVEGGGLVDRRLADRGAGDQRARDGHRQAHPTSWRDHPLGPGRSPGSRGRRNAAVLARA
jgi:hypothetical protein